MGCAYIKKRLSRGQQLLWNSQKNKEVCITLWPLPFTFKSILRRQKKKNYGNSNISPMQKYINLQNIIFQKSSYKKIDLLLLVLLLLPRGL